MSKGVSAADARPLAAQETRALFAPWKNHAAWVIAVSGGPDSTALLWLAARWRAQLKNGPRIVAVTVDHGLRKESAGEARTVKKLAARLGVEHRSVAWRGAKPASGVQAAARAARYALLAKAARRAGATAILTAHTSDDQAETVLMRMARGSGLPGLAAMAAETLRDGIALVRPFLAIPKTRLIATAQAAGLTFARDASNDDPRFARVRWRAVMPPLAAEGLDSRALARLARRIARANAALDAATAAARKELVRLAPATATLRIDAAGFRALPEEIQLRLLGQAIAETGHEGPVELGKLETLLAGMQPHLRALPVSGAARGGLARSRLRRTLAGALITLAGGWLEIAPAPARRSAGKRVSGRPAPAKALLTKGASAKRSGRVFAAGMR